MEHEQHAQLREPFPAEQIGKLPRITCKKCREAPSKVCSEHSKSRCDGCQNYITSAHIHLDYVGHAATTDRLLKVDPLWSWEPRAVDEQGMPVLTNVGTEPGEPIGLWIRLTIADVTRPGFGSGKTVKEAIGDAIRNAAMRFGVALDLWAKQDLHDHEDAVVVETAGREFSPGKDLLEGAPRGAQAMTQIAEMQKHADPSMDWQALGAGLRLDRYGKAEYAELRDPQRVDWMYRYSNALTRLTAGMSGDFPPVTDDQIREAFSWAFEGAVVAIPVGEAALPSEAAGAAPAGPEPGADEPGGQMPPTDGDVEEERLREMENEAMAEAEAAAARDAG